MAAPWFTTMDTAVPASPFPGAAPKPFSSWPGRASAQRDCLERTHDVVRSLRGEKTFVIAGAEVPVIPAVMRVAVKTPDAIHDDDRADPVIPKFAQIMKAQVCPRRCSLKSDVIKYDHLGKRNICRLRLSVRCADGASMITKRPDLPFRVDHAAV